MIDGWPANTPGKGGEVSAMRSCPVEPCGSPVAGSGAGPHQAYRRSPTSVIEVSPNVHFSAEPARKVAYQHRAQGGRVDALTADGWFPLYGSILDSWGPDYVTRDSCVERAAHVTAYRLWGF